MLWFSSGGGNNEVVGWFDPKKFDQTHDEAASQGWAPFIIDTNGNGKRDAGWVEPKGKMDPAKDMRIVTGSYSVSPNPADGTVWGRCSASRAALLASIPRRSSPNIMRCLGRTRRSPRGGFAPRGGDITSDGVFWTVLASGDFASFDRKLCKGKLSGPALADPQNLCPEGWKLYQMPGPEFENLPQGTPGRSTEAPYYNWVDQYDTLGLGKNIPIATGNQSDSLRLS
jgi:hypothetical protein